MRSKYTRGATVAAVAAAVALSLTACGGDGDATAEPGAPSSGASTGAGGRSATPSSGSAGRPEPSGTAAALSPGGGTSQDTDGSDGDSTGDCRTDRMEIGAVDNSTGGGSGVVTVSFRNDDSAACRMNGYAGVDLKTADGDTLSLPRDGETATPAVLRSGESAAFNIHYPVDDSGGTGVRPVDIVVTAPNDTAQATVAWPGGSLPITEGGGGGPSITPVGKVG